MSPAVTTETGEPATAPRRAAFARLVRRPRYPGFVLTVLLSRVGVTMFGTAGVLLVLDRTHSAPLAGATAAAALLPGAISGPLLGAWLEVAARRRVLIVFDQLLSIVGLLALVALAGHAPGWTLPAVAVVYSVTRPFSSGTFFSALAEIAGPELLDAASQVEASSLNLAFVIGPALAGTLAAAAGPATAVEVQAGITATAAVLFAANPAFEARPAQQAESALHALRLGTRALLRERMVRSTGAAATLAALGWGLMLVGFPLYAAHNLHAGASAGGYMWGAIALGSIVGTFALRGAPSLVRVGLSYAALGASALLWPLAHVLVLGVLLVGFTGFLEGPAYSGTIALRQRHTPPHVRAQVMTTLTGIAQVAVSLGAALGGAIDHVTTLVIAFTAINAAAALTAVGGPLALRRRRRRPPPAA